MITVTLTDETWGACLDAVEIRMSQYQEMGKGRDPCPERYELEDGDAEDMALFYSQALDELTENNYV